MAFKAYIHLPFAGKKNAAAIFYFDGILTASEFDMNIDILLFDTDVKYLLTYIDNNVMIVYSVYAVTSHCKEKCTYEYYNL